MRRVSHRSTVCMCSQDFLGRGPADPYTRFIAPAEFRQLTRYDVSGAGVNLVTAEEFTTKLGRALPRGRAPSGSGAWVVGLVKVRPPLQIGLLFVFLPLTSSRRIVAITQRRRGPCLLLSRDIGSAWAGDGRYPACVTKSSAHAHARPQFLRRNEDVCEGVFRVGVG